MIPYPAQKPKTTFNTSLNSLLLSDLFLEKVHLISMKAIITKAKAIKYLKIIKTISTEVMYLSCLFLNL